MPLVLVNCRYAVRVLLIRPEGTIPDGVHFLLVPTIRARARYAAENATPTRANGVAQPRRP
jgi:hypothetical protein